MEFSLELIVIVALSIWVVVLTLFFLNFYMNSSAIVRDSKKSSVLGLLEEVKKIEASNKKELDLLRADYVKLEKLGLAHIQKIGLVRFNPFKDTGGDQSFILALVDAEDTGVIISSLHTRTGTRWYAKSVIKGKGNEYDLSEEEEKALSGAASLSVSTKKK